MKKNYFILFVGIIISTISCSREENFVQPQDRSDFPVVNRDNILVFPSEETLQKVLADELELPFSVSFVSQKDLFNKIMDAEYTHACSLKDLSDAEYEKCQRHSNLYLQALNRTFIKEEVYKDNSILYDLNILYPGYAKILNEQGFYAIKDTIFQVTSNELRAWENCKTLEDINKTTCKIRYSEAAKTKSLFPLHSIDQSVAYVFNSGVYPTDRSIVTFYDKTKLAIPNVTRDLYVRVSLQRKVDGRNYTYLSAPYVLTAAFYLNIEGEEKVLWLNGNGTSGNDWYTPYLEYEFLSGGKITQTYTSVYYYITKFILRNTYKVQHPDAPYEWGKEDQISVWFEGERQTALAGPFFYSSSNMSQPFSPLLPEDN